MGCDFREGNPAGRLRVSAPLHPALGDGGQVGAGWDGEPWEPASTHRIPWVEVALPLRGQPLEFQVTMANGHWGLVCVPTAKAQTSNTRCQGQTKGNIKVGLSEEVG